jgi:hypothetical protein
LGTRGHQVNLLTLTVMAPIPILIIPIFLDHSLKLKLTPSSLKLTVFLEQSP